MPVSKLLTLPYGSYLMVRLDYIIICGDELEAKIMRIIEMYMDDERRILYKELLNDPKNTIEPESTVEITKDVWAAISHRLFKNDLYDQDMSENTLKRAIKSLVKKSFIRVRDDRTKRYEAPKYQINTEAVQAKLDTLGKIGKTEYQKLMVSKIDGIKNASHQTETPSDHQNLTVSHDLMVSKFDPNSRRITDTVDGLVEEGTYGNVASELPTPAPAASQDYQPDFSAPQNKPYASDGTDGHSCNPPIGEIHEPDGHSNSPARSHSGINHRNELDDQQSAARHTSGTAPTQQQAPVVAELSTSKVSSPQMSAKVEPKPGNSSSKAVANGKTTIPATAQVKPQLTLLGGQVRTDYETIRACRLRLTANNIKSLNVLGELDGMNFVNLKETIELIEEQSLVKSKNIPIDPQALASEEGYWRFDKWLEVVVRNRQRQASQSGTQPPPTSSSLPSFSGMSDKEYYASLSKGGTNARFTHAR